MDLLNVRVSTFLVRAVSVREERPVGTDAFSYGGHEAAGGSSARQLHVQHGDDGLLESGESRRDAEHLVLREMWVVQSVDTD